MQVTLEIPDAFAAQLEAAGKNPSRAALEALAIEGYRSWQLNEYQVRLMLGYESRHEVWELFAEHRVERQMDEEYIRQEIAAARTPLNQKTSQVA